MRRQHCSASTIPYTPLTCIIGTGTQYINTLYRYTNNVLKYRIVLSYAKTTASGNNVTHIFGSYTNPDNAWHAGYTDANLSYSTQYYLGATRQIRWISDYDLQRHLIDFTTQNNTTILTVDSTTTTPAYAGSIVSNSDIYIFASSKANVPALAKKTAMKLYYCKIYEDDVIVRDFVPALDSNNVACLYDRVSQTFFYNAGTGTFNYEV